LAQRGGRVIPVPFEHLLSKRRKNVKVKVVNG